MMDPTAGRVNPIGSNSIKNWWSVRAKTNVTPIADKTMYSAGPFFDPRTNSATGVRFCTGGGEFGEAYGFDGPIWQFDRAG